MLKYVLTAVVAAALVAIPAAPSLAQAAAEKTEKAKRSAAKKLTPQQQKMKDCGAKWQDYKKEKNVKGRAEYSKFLKTCLSG
jgi:Ni/Co efflux regulator RcnB